MTTLDSVQALRYHNPPFLKTCTTRLHIVSNAVPIMTTLSRTERGQKLRTLNWLKQVRNELTSAEFALQLEEEISAAPKTDGVRLFRRKRPIDYESIISRLEQSLLFIEQGGMDALAVDIVNEDEIKELQQRLQRTVKDVSTAISKQRQEIYGGIQSDLNGIEQPESAAKYAHNSNGFQEKLDITTDVTESQMSDEEEHNNNSSSNKDKKVPEFGLFVRDDGTVDWDGAIQSGREVAKFGKELWERINGQDPHDSEGKQHQLFGGTKSKKLDPPHIQVMLDKEIELIKEAAALRNEADDAKYQLSLLGRDFDSSARRELIFSARLKTEAAILAERRVEIHRLDTDMERICYSIEQDIKESATSPREHRLLVAEFGMLDAQLRSLALLLDSRSSDDTEPDLLFRFGDVITEDGSELELIKREVGDLKMRLGMNLALESPVFSLPDMEKISRYIKDAAEKLNSAFVFFLTGIKLLGQDVQYALTLVTKAVQGYTLKPREVRTLRRNGKDLLTLIPTFIILVAPLSPLGHVLVFSFIQRYFPDFFPSTFTERRQNLLKMYEEVEKVEHKGDDEKDPTQDALENLRKKFVGTLYKDEQK